MPSPVGHALAGIAAGYLVAGSGAPGRREGSLLTALVQTSRSGRCFGFGLLGMLPDVDFMFGSHSTFTHSVGAVVVAGFGGAVLATRTHRGVRMRYGVAVAAAYGSHVLLDWLGTDDTPPLGVMALWPFSSRFFLSGREWFLGVCRQYDELSCWLHNAQGVAWESLALGLLAVTAVALARRR